MDKSLALKGIRNIIFDLGNVIIDLDIQATDDKFSALFGLDRELAFQNLQHNNVFQQFEKGEIDANQFIAELIKVSKNEIKDSQIIEAWNAMLLTIPDSRFELLLQLKNRYRTFCLSNTNELHASFIFNQLKATNGETSLNPYFEKVYLSHEIGMRKPDVEIFEKVIHDNNLIAEETLFIDDTLGHLEGAKKLGIQTYHHLPGKEIVDLFRG